MSKHTPGPWRFSEVWRPPIGNLNYEPRNASGDVFWGYSISGSNEYGGAILPTLAAVHNFPEQMKANAYLIAAAPDMRAVLEKSVHALETLAAKLDEVGQTPFADILRAGAKEQRTVIDKADGK